MLMNIYNEKKQAEYGKLQKVKFEEGHQESVL